MRSGEFPPIKEKNSPEECVTPGFWKRRGLLKTKNTPEPLFGRFLKRKWGGGGNISPLLQGVLSTPSTPKRRKNSVFSPLPPRQGVGGRIKLNIGEKKKPHWPQTGGALTRQGTLFFSRGKGKAHFTLLGKPRVISFRWGVFLAFGANHRKPATLNGGPFFPGSR